MAANNPQILIWFIGRFLGCLTLFYFAVLSLRLCKYNLMITLALSGIMDLALIFFLTVRFQTILNQVNYSKDVLEQGQALNKSEVERDLVCTIFIPTQKYYLMLIDFRMTACEIQ